MLQLSRIQYPLSKVKRRKDFVIARFKNDRHLGSSFNEINNIEQNISQFPTAIEFYEDSAYSKIVTNTVSNVDSYFGGIGLLV